MKSFHGLFLDHNASHPMLPSVRQALAEKLEHDKDFFSNPMSVHARGRHAKRLLFELKDSLCQWLGLRTDEEVIINSGATEGINTVIAGFVRHRKNLGRSPVIMLSAIEHSAVHSVCEDLVDTKVIVIPVNKNGQLDTEFIFKRIEELLLDPKTDVLFALQIANNEIGSCFDFSFQEDLHRLYGQRPHLHLPKKKGGKHPLSDQRIWYLLDAAQAVGKLEDAAIRKPLHYADYLVFSGHKIGAPMGIGVLWVRASAPFHAQIHGGPQEKKRRAGTHNMMGVYGLTIAVRDWIRHGDQYREQISEIRDELEKQLMTIPGIVLHSPGPGMMRLCNTINLSASECPDESLLMGLDLKGVFVSSGAACNSGSVKPSTVLLNMGFSEDIARSSIRISLGVESRMQDVTSFMTVFTATVEQIRRAQKIADEFLPKLTTALQIQDSVG